MLLTGMRFLEKLAQYRYAMESCNHWGQRHRPLGPKIQGWDYAVSFPIHIRYRFDAYSGQGLINISQELLEGQLQYEHGLIELIYSCTTCGACDINCKSIRDMEVLETILALRARSVEDGRANAGASQMVDSVAETHNIYGSPISKGASGCPPTSSHRGEQGRLFRRLLRILFASGYSG